MPLAEKRIALVRVVGVDSFGWENRRAMKAGRFGRQKAFIWKQELTAFR